MSISPKSNSLPDLLEALENHLVDYPTPENIHMQRKYLSDIRQHHTDQPDELREAFIRWAMEPEHCFSNLKPSGNSFVEPEVHSAWQAWQAAWEHKREVVEVPKEPSSYTAGWGNGFKCGQNGLVPVTQEKLARIMCEARGCDYDSLNDAWKDIQREHARIVIAVIGGIPTTDVEGGATNG